ncbi:unnamed protein product [Pleuronectes platessa]|uniref:Uncharacterized protein n=1 Tax=Pleuronectes platessa TaxID=8262 RepID=A0A9N7ULU3_PLEPL|nr:unnamed protein product [Pleuronectes platessa]
MRIFARAARRSNKPLARFSNPRWPKTLQDVTNLAWMPDELSPAHNILVGQFGLESLHWEKIMGRVSTDQEVKFLFAQLDRPTTNQSNVLAPIHSHVKTLCRSHRRLKHREAALAQRGASASGVTGTKPCSDLLDQRVILLALPGGSASLQCPV